MFCSNCGQKLEDSAVFCPSCGIKVAAEATYTATPAYEPAPTYAPPVAPPLEYYAQFESQKETNSEDVKKKRSASISAMIFGILSICLFWVPILGIVFALISKKKQKAANKIDVQCANGFLRAAKPTSTVGLIFSIIYSAVALIYPIMIIIIYTYMIIIAMFGGIAGGLYY